MTLFWDAKSPATTVSLEQHSLQHVEPRVMVCCLLHGETQDVQQLASDVSWKGHHHVVVLLCWAFDPVCAEYGFAHQPPGLQGAVKKSWELYLAHVLGGHLLVFYFLLLAGDPLGLASTKGSWGHHC